MDHLLRPHAAVLRHFIALALNSGRRHVLIYGLVWVVAGDSVPWWTLLYDYVINNPRVLYLPSVGVALIWANLITEARNRIRLRWVCRSTLLAMLLAALRCLCHARKPTTLRDRIASDAESLALYC